MMSVHVENMYRELNHTFLVPDTFHSNTSLLINYTVIVNFLLTNWYKVVGQICNVNMVGNNIIFKKWAQKLCSLPTNT